MQDYGEDEENGEQWRCRVDHGGMREGSAEGQGVEAKSCDDQSAESIRCCPFCVDKLEQRLLVISVSYIQSARRQLKVKCLSASVPSSASSTHPSSYPQLRHGGAGIAQWLERRTYDRKITGSSLRRSHGRIFFSGVNFLC